MIRGTVWCPIWPSMINWETCQFWRNSWAGRGSEPVRRWGPESSLRVSPMTRGTCGTLCSKWILQKKWLGPPLTFNLLINNLIQLNTTQNDNQNRVSEINLLIFCFTLDLGHYQTLPSAFHYCFWVHQLLQVDVKSLWKVNKEALIWTWHLSPGCGMYK